MKVIAWQNHIWDRRESDDLETLIQSLNPGQHPEVIISNLLSSRCMMMEGNTARRRPGPRWKTIFHFDRPYFLRFLDSHSEIQISWIHIPFQSDAVSKKDLDSRSLGKRRWKNHIVLHLYKCNTATNMYHHYQSAHVYHHQYQYVHQVQEKPNH